MSEMIINRYNYQEYFLLYTDNELTVAERNAVDDFVQQNPDLKNELVMLQQSVLTPDPGAIFENKDLLLRFDDATSFIYPGNFGEFAVSYADNELDDVERRRLEAFVLDNPDFKEEFDLIQSLKFTPEVSVVFPGKEQLYRYEKERKPVVIPWWRIAAAAIIVLSLGLLWLNKSPDSSPSNNLVRIQKPVSTVIPEPGVMAETRGEATANDTSTHAGTSEDPDDKTDKNIAGVGKKSHVVHKTEMLASKKGRAAYSPSAKKPGKDRADSNNVVAISSAKQAPPQSASLNTNSQSSTGTTTRQAIAAIEESIERKNKKIPDQPAIIVNAANNNDYRLASFVTDTEPDENVSISGIPLDNKNPLRVILRKASRFIDKNTASRTSRKSGILIGNIEIAFQ